MRTGVRRVVSELGGRELLEDVAGTVGCSREAQCELTQAVHQAVTGDSKFAFTCPVSALFVELDSALPTRLAKGLIHTCWFGI